MTFEQHIQEIKNGIKLKIFQNEESVKQGIILRILTALSWPCYDTKIVYPEYKLEGTRVDYTLFNKYGTPVVFIEVKQIGIQTDDYEKQLFQYAFHQGIPLAILTDGREWSFYLPAEAGDYKDRRLYKLNILERDITECMDILKRYLDFDRTLTSETLEVARSDYKNAKQIKLIENTLPIVMKKLIEERDEKLIDLIAENVENICGFKAEEALIISFLDERITISDDNSTKMMVNNKKTVKPIVNSKATRRHYLNEDFKDTKPKKIIFQGKVIDVKSWKDAYVKFIKLLLNIDSDKIENLPNNPDFITTRGLKYFSNSEDPRTELRMWENIDKKINAAMTLSANSLCGIMLKLLKLYNLDIKCLEIIIN
jgi:predicted type IV restriction endonuclease